jgi:hypothetical protein
MKKTIIIVIACIICINNASYSQSIKAASPTHLFYTPTAYVNKPFELVASLHEVSFALPANLQLQFSLFDNIGRINFGARYGILDNFSVGAGMAYNWIHLGQGKHGIMAKDGANPRLGLNLTYGFVQTDAFECAVTPHMQLGDYFSVGVDFGLMGTPHETWSIIWEVGTSVTNYVAGGVKGGATFYLNTDGGVRIHPPKVPFLYFDFGIDLEEFAVNVPNPHATVGPFLDVIFAMRTK